MIGTRACRPPFPLADDAHRFEAVHHRHLDVHQDQVVGFRLHFVDRDHAVFGFVDSGARILEIGADKETIVPCIVDQQNAQRTFFRRGTLAVDAERSGAPLG